MLKIFFSTTFDLKVTKTKNGWCEKQKVKKKFEKKTFFFLFFSKTAVNPFIEKKTANGELNPTDFFQIFPSSLKVGIFFGGGVAMRFLVTKVAKHAQQC